MSKIKIIECPRDAIQGIKQFIPTEKKVTYLQTLLKVGFDTLDCGSFVSPKAVPQMVDTATVIKGLDCSQSSSKLLVIVANERGAMEACQHDKIAYLGYPFSISENFQMRNTHKSIKDSLTVLRKILALCKAHNKKAVIYLSMGFGNPYGDPWSPTIVLDWVEKLIPMGAHIISLSDTVGQAKSKDIEQVLSKLIVEFPKVEFGTHFHTHPQQWREKVNVAFNSGCNRFDGAIRGWGGCPMAQDELVGNMPTEKLISYFTALKKPLGLDLLAFESAYNEFNSILS